jgi:hypothetical protein
MNYLNLALWLAILIVISAIAIRFKVAKDVSGKTGIPLRDFFTNSLPLNVKTLETYHALNKYTKLQNRLFWIPFILIGAIFFSALMLTAANVKFKSGEELRKFDKFEFRSLADQRGFIYRFTKSDTFYVKKYSQGLSDETFIGVLTASEKQRILDFVVQKDSIVKQSKIDFENFKEGFSIFLKFNNESQSVSISRKYASSMVTQFAEWLNILDARLIKTDKKLWFEDDEFMHENLSSEK